MSTRCTGRLSSRGPTVYVNCCAYTIKHGYNKVPGTGDCAYIVISIILYIDQYYKVIKSRNENHFPVSINSL